MKKAAVIQRKRTTHKDGMCKCGINPATTPHPCPYQEEINQDYTAMCTCCSDCEGQCLGDI